jgi:hypothetical protein
MTPDEVIARIRLIEAELGRQPTSHDRGVPTRAAIAHFGSWREALIATGFDVRERKPRPTTWTCDTLIARIQELAAELGRAPTAHDPGAPDSAAVRHFGSWAAAVEAAGFERPQRRGVRGQPRTPTILNQSERETLGFIATIREQSTLRTEVHHVVGPPMQALREFLAELDARAGDWRILCYSTPNTIASDLRRTRPRRGRGGRSQQRFVPPEVNVLGKVKRYDMLDPSIPRGKKLAAAAR